MGLCVEPLQVATARAATATAEAEQAGSAACTAAVPQGQRLAKTLVITANTGYAQSSPDHTP
jgi:hypothetical protein